MPLTESELEVEKKAFENFVINTQKNCEVEWNKDLGVRVVYLHKNYVVRWFPLESEWKSWLARAELEKEKRKK